MNIDPVDYPVMKMNCKTCPFKLDEHGRMNDPELANRVTERTLFNSNQLCHDTENKTRCKGSFDFNFSIYDRMGYGHLVK